MKREIFVRLIGGIGNQLFQYACAKNLAIELNASLFIDDKTGFFFDRKFNRNNSLPKNLNYKKIGFLNLIWFYTFLIFKKIFFKNKFFFTFKNGIFIDETNKKEFIKNFFKITKNYEKIYLNGFFQSENYFIKNKKKIISEILKNKITNRKVSKIKKKISKKTICIGMRIFEEAPENIRYNFGGIEGFKFYNDAINFFKKKIKKSNFIVFSTIKDKSRIKKNINTKLDIFNEKYNDTDDLNYLLLMSCFSNFIISNSSFYWWGAYLANFNKDIKIVASKKFVNINTVPKIWKKQF